MYLCKHKYVNRFVLDSKTRYSYTKDRPPALRQFLVKQMLFDILIHYAH